MLAKRFQLYDYGTEKNMELYEDMVPPAY